MLSLDLGTTQCMLRQCCERCSRLFSVWEAAIEHQPTSSGRDSELKSGKEWGESRVEVPVVVVCDSPEPPMSVTQARMVGQAVGLGHKHLFHKTLTGKHHNHPYRNIPITARSALHHHHHRVTCEEGVCVECPCGCSLQAILYMSSFGLKFQLCAAYAPDLCMICRVSLVSLEVTLHDSFLSCFYQCTSSSSSSKDNGLLFSSFISTSAPRNCDTRIRNNTRYCHALHF